MKLSVISPVYNGANTLSEFHRRLTAVLDPLGLDYEVVYVDDASIDESWSVIRGIAERDHRVKGLRLAENVRQTRAIAAGATATGEGRGFVVIDSDLEDPPEAIPELVEMVRAGHDLVVVTRVKQRGSRLRKMGSKSIAVVSRLLRLKVPDVGSSFLISDDRVADVFRSSIGLVPTQFVLPLVVDSAKNPTVLTVGSGREEASGYSTSALVEMAVEFVRAFVFRRVAALLGITGGSLIVSSAVSGKSPRLQRQALRWGTISLILASLFRFAALDLTPTQIDLYTVAERC